MAKSYGGGAVSSMDTMVALLKDNNTEARRTSGAIIKFINSQKRAEMVAGKEALEASAEGKAGGRSRIGGLLGMAGRGLGTTVMAPLKGIGGLLGAAGGALTLGFAPIMAALKPLVKLLKVGGPIGLLFGGMYALFKDIGENEQFNATVTAIKDTFNNNIKPTFESIKEKVSALMAMDGVGETFTTIGNWFTNFKTQIQDFVLENLANITAVISGVLDGIDLLLSNEWKAGISTIGTSLFNGIKNLFDSAITNILELFGMDFGEGGSFLTSVGGIIDRTLIKLINVWTSLTDGIKETWEGMVNFFVGEDGYVMSTITSLKIGITTRWNKFTSAITNTWDTIVTALTDPTAEGSLPFTILATKDFILDKWESFKLVFTETVPNTILAIKDGMIETWNNVQTAITNALESVKLWFETKPVQLGMVLEEMWIKTKGAFMEKLAAFAGMITTIPSRLKLALLESLKGSLLGDYFVTDSMINKARSAVASGNEFSERLITEANSNTEAQLAELAARRSALDASIAERQAAMNVVAPVTTVSAPQSSTVNLNSTGSSIADPYASSYMGRMIPGAF